MPQSPNQAIEQAQTYWSVIYYQQAGQGVVRDPNVKRFLARRLVEPIIETNQENIGTGGGDSLHH